MTLVSRRASSSHSTATMPIILVAQFTTPMAIAGTAIALPRIAGDLGAQPTLLQWVVNGFNVAFAVATLLWGSVGDRIGHRATFRIGAALTAAASLVSAVAPSLLLLDAARVVAGIGAAAVLVGASSLISTLYEGPRRTRAFAVFGTVNGLGLALGPTISGLLVAATGWRGVFVVHAAVLTVAAIAAIALPRPTITGSPGARAARVLDLSLLRNREFLAMCLVPVAASIGFVTLLTYLPSALSAIRGTSPGAAGLVMLAMTVPVLVSPMVIAHLVTRHPRITVTGVVYVSFAALIAGAAGLLLLTPDRPIGWLLAPMVLLGLGFGMPVGLVDGHALSVVPADRAGTASGLLNFFRIGSEAVFVAGYAWLLATIVGTRLSGSAADDTAAGRPGHADVYQHALGVTVAVLIGLVVAILLAFTAIRRADQPAERP